MSKFQELVAAELIRARAKHPDSERSFHGAYGVLFEEVDEVWDLVRSQKPAQEDLLRELVEVAAMAERFAEETLSVL